MNRMILRQIALLYCLASLAAQAIADSTEALNQPFIPNADFLEFIGQEMELESLGLDVNFLIKERLLDTDTERSSAPNDEVKKP